MSITVPLSSGDLARLRRAVRDVSNRIGRRLRPVRVPLRNLASCPLFTVGVLVFDYGVYQWSHRVGWMVGGVSLMILEHVIADEE